MHGTTHFVLISTDKAVRPTSIMGATKRLAEVIVREAAARSKRHFVVVRFGNVLGSRGSVVQTFMAQIERGGPVTVTHPEMRRFLITIPEVVQPVRKCSSLTKTSGARSAQGSYPFWRQTRSWRPPRGSTNPSKW